MGYNWQWYQIPKYIYSYTDDGFQFGELMFGLWTTITLSFSALILAMLFGLLVALLRLSNLVIGTKVAICFFEFVALPPDFFFILVPQRKFILSSLISYFNYFIGRIFYRLPCITITIVIVRNVLLSPCPSSLPLMIVLGLCLAYGVFVSMIRL